MSNPYNPLGVSGMLVPPRPTAPAAPEPPRFGMTDYEQRLNPVYDQQMEEELQGRRKIQPLRKILDLLQRGQYVSANIVNSILEGDNAKELLTAAWQGLTGEVKGSYQDVIRDHFKDWGERKLFKNAEEGTWRSKVDNAKVFGFLGDVFLDPTTYVGFGATGGARAAAKSYADDVVRVLSKEIGERVGREGAGRGMQEGLEVLGRSISATGITGKQKAMQKMLDEAYRTAYRKSLRMGGQELSEGLAKRIGDLPGLEDLTKKLADPTNYGKAGESAWNLGLLGRSEALKSHRPAFNRGMAAMSRAIKENPAAATFESAWWSVMNRGPLGKIRELVNIRSPYATSLRHKELKEGNQFLRNAEGEMAMNVRRVVTDLSDDERDQVVKLFSRAEHATKTMRSAPQATSQWGMDIGHRAVPTSVSDMLNNPAILAEIGITDVDKIRKGVADLGTLTEGWNKRAKVIADALDLSYTAKADYLPAALKNMTGGRGSGGAGFMKHKKMTRVEHAADDVNRIEWLYDVSTDEAKDMLGLVPGLGSISNDLEESLLARGLAQTKLEQRFNIIEQFGELGIPIKDMGAKAQDVLRHGIDNAELGLKTIQGVPGLDGKLFDYEVATVAEHALNLTGPKNINSVQQLFQKFTSFWKGIVTMTPGFHLRNFYSNQIMQIMKHGAKAMNPKNMTDSLAGVLYALDKTNLKKAAADFNIDHSILARRLKTTRGNLPLEVLSDEAHRLGVISTDLHGQNASSILEQAMGKTSLSPVSKNFAGRKASQWMGERVENLARFQSFVMDYELAAAKIGDVTDVAEILRLDKDALEYASMEAKKWFMDYGDLSDFEQGVLKQVIPFYSWLRKNIVNQVQAVVLYPEIFSMVPKIEELFTYEHPDYDPDYIPDWMKQMGMFPTGQLEDGSFRMFNPNFPYQDLNKIPLTWEEDSWLPKLTFAEAKDDIVAGMHPMIRSAMSLATENGYDFFHKQELEETADAPYLMRLFASNPGIIGLVDGLQAARGLDSTMQLDDEGKLQMDGQVAALLEQNMPLLRWFEFLFYLPQAVIPGLEDMVESTTNAQDDYEGMAETLQLMSYYLGIKFSPADLEKEKLRVGRDIYYRSRDILNDQNRDSLGAQTRRMQYNNSTDASIRRLRG